MVRIEENKIIIEIESKMPLSDLTDYQHAIIEVLMNCTEPQIDPFTNYRLGELLENILPTFEQSTNVYSASNN